MNMNEQELRNYETLKRNVELSGGRFVKEYRAYEGDYRVIVEYPNKHQARYTVSGEHAGQM